MTIDIILKNEIKKLEKELLRLKLLLPDVGNRTLSEKPIRYECLLCGRNKFIRKSPHLCNSGYRKHKIKWKPIYK